MNVQFVKRSLKKMKKLIKSLANIFFTRTVFSLG